MSALHRDPDPRRAASACAAAAARAAMAAGALVLAATTAFAQTSPWYIGAAQTVTHESNLYRLADGVSPGGGAARSDTLASTALLAGLDQPIGRQRVYGSLSLRANRFSSNGELDNNGYAINVGAELATVGELSGRIDLSSNRSLAEFNPDADVGLVTRRNVERGDNVALDLRLGGAAQLALVAGARAGRVRYSAEEFTSRERDHRALSLGLRYRPVAATVFGVGLRRSTLEYPQADIDTNGDPVADGYARDDLDLTLQMQPSGASNLYARLSFGRTGYDRDTERDYSGVTGALVWNWQATGKVHLSTRLLRDAGQTATDIEFGSFRLGFSKLSQWTLTLQTLADYQATAKVHLNAGLALRSRRLVREPNVLAPERLSGNDTTAELSLGARWEPTRSTVLGCDIGHERRTTDRRLSTPYTAGTFGCYGQIFLR